MPIADVRGVNINYQVLGEHGLRVALSPGGRRDLGVVLPLAELVAKGGYRVLIHGDSWRPGSTSRAAALEAPLTPDLDVTTVITS